MKKKLVSKGCYGYIRNHRMVAAVRTLLFFGVSIGLYVMGYVTSGSNQNLLTIVAVLGCLPACKSLVNLIIFLKAEGCSEALENKVSTYDANLLTFYDMYFTSYQKNYPISHLVLKGNILCGITEDSRCSCKDAESHLEQMLTQEGIKNVTINIFSDEEKYIDRLSRLKDLEVDISKNKEDILHLLYAVSL